MNRIEGLDEAHRLVGRFEWSELRTVRRLSWETDNSGPKNCHVELEMECHERKPKFAVTLKFSGAQRLRISEFGCPMRIIGFCIKDIADRQWEGLRWEIGDFENSEIGFHCAEIRVLSCVLL